MEIQANKNYVKMNLPNGTVVDVLSPVLDQEMAAGRPFKAGKWRVYSRLST